MLSRTVFIILDETEHEKSQLHITGEGAAAIIFITLNQFTVTI